MRTARTRRTAAAAAAIAMLALVAAACDSSKPVTGPGTNPTSQFASEIGLPELEGSLSGGTARWEIKLVPGTLTARKVQVERPEDVADEEKIEGRASAVSVMGSDGALSLEIDGLEIGFDMSTRFGAEDGDLTFDEFVARVEAELAAGRQPAVKAKREPAAEPQAPDDPTFLAARLELDNESGEPKIEMNVDADNLELNDSGMAPDGWVTVLNLRIELRVRDGTTELEEETTEASGSAEFEGIVASVEQDGGGGGTGSVTLGDGTVVLITDGTSIDGGSDDGMNDDGEHLTTLEQVQAALDAGLIVEADGEGVLEAQGPPTFTAIEVEFSVQNEADDVPGAAQFEDDVVAASAAGGTITLASGVTVRLSDDLIDPDGDLLTLQAVADAIAAEQPVRAEGHADVESAGPPAVLAAQDVKFEIDD